MLLVVLFPAVRSFSACSLIRKYEVLNSSSSSFEFEFELARNFLDLFKSIPSSDLIMSLDENYYNRVDSIST